MKNLLVYMHNYVLLFYINCFSVYLYLFNIDILKLISNFFLLSPPRIKDEPEDDNFFVPPKEDIKPLKRPRDEDE